MKNSIIDAQQELEEQQVILYRQAWADFYVGLGEQVAEFLSYKPKKLPLNFLNREARVGRMFVAGTGGEIHEVQSLKDMFYNSNTNYKIKAIWKTKFEPM